MARLAVTRADSWVRVSDWETRQEGWSRTRSVKIRPVAVRDHIF